MPQRQCSQLLVWMSSWNAGSCCSTLMLALLSQAAQGADGSNVLAVSAPTSRASSVGQQSPAAPFDADFHGFARNSGEIDAWEMVQVQTACNVTFSNLRQEISRPAAACCPCIYREMTAPLVWHGTMQDGGVLYNFEGSTGLSARLHPAAQAKLSAEDAAIWQSEPAGSTSRFHCPVATFQHTNLALGLPHWLQLPP